MNIAEIQRKIPALRTNEEIAFMIEFELKDRKAKRELEESLSKFKPGTIVTEKKFWKMRMLWRRFG